MQIYSGVGKRRLEDATSLAPSPPAAVSAVIDRLAPLGFERIGVRSAVLPGEKRAFEWDLVDVQGTTFIAIVSAAGMRGGAYMACYSAFAEGAFLSTSFPQGSKIRRADLDTAAAGTTPEECVAAHYQRLAEFKSNHGAPLVNRTMADLLVRDDTYRRLHAGATLRTRVYTYVALAALVVFVTGAQLLKVLSDF